jgi:hypothetical protein
MQTDMHRLPLITDVHDGFVNPIRREDEPTTTLELRTEDGEELVLPLTRAAVRKLAGVLSRLTYEL